MKVNGWPSRLQRKKMVNLKGENYYFIKKTENENLY